jgi:sulfoxide reductase catalytic subunit YedY
MNKWQSPRIRSSEITPEAVYLNRRQFMKGAAAVTAGALLAACAPKADPTPVPTEVAMFTGLTDELGGALTSYEAITGYNNYYEFTTDKEGVAPMSQGFKTRPWTVEVSGLVNQPRTYDIDELMTRFASRADLPPALRGSVVWSFHGAASR